MYKKFSAEYYQEYKERLKKGKSLLSIEKNIVE